MKRDNQLGDESKKRKEKRFLTTILSSSYCSSPPTPGPPSREQDINLLLLGLSVGQGSRGSRFLFYYLETARETDEPHSTSCFSFFLVPGLGALCSVLIRRNFGGKLLLPFFFLTFFSSFRFLRPFFFLFVLLEIRMEGGSDESFKG